MQARGATNRMSYVFPPYTLMGFLEFLCFLTFFILGLYVDKHAQALIGAIDGKILLLFVVFHDVFHCFSSYTSRCSSMFSIIEFPTHSCWFLFVQGQT
jgi:predicted xylose isomerase-like sugar epimerase